ncbi:DnaA ATPase domain-containing protein [Paenibacillus rhizophilus]|uniref:AAA family ATPase n=2 Tax=Paenibacillus rhizophilus TaxID=1850366 RepID=A0A3N9P4Z2_9BACL|nr:DnaA/Hda family protein [Paenibacillus rhizophilus]RQW10397.1 AAA family ATPase [Paenibacillus rhizophilus]
MSAAPEQAQPLTTRPSSEPVCIKCRGQEGEFYRDEKGYEYWRDCECVKRKKAERLMHSSNITEEFQSKSFGTFEKEDLHPDVSTAHDLAYEYTKNFLNIRKSRMNSIALLGQPGCGKTHLLMAVSNNLIKRGIEVIYFPWVEGWTEICEDYKLMPERVRRLQRAEVLFIDDVYKGRDEPTKTQREQFFAIVNYRYMENLPMLISSERTIAEMCQFDEAVGSRINEMCRDYKAIINKNMELNRRLK